MITMEQRLRDVRRDKKANFWLESYSSVPEINRILRLMSPFKFSTLDKLAPRVKMMLFPLMTHAVFLCGTKRIFRFMMVKENRI